MRAIVRHILKDHDLADSDDGVPRVWADVTEHLADYCHEIRKPRDWIAIVVRNAALRLLNVKQNQPQLLY